MERLSCFKTLDCWRWTPFWSVPSAIGVTAKSKDKYPCLFLNGQQSWKNKKGPWGLGVQLPLYPASSENFGLLIHWLRTSGSVRVHRRTLWSTCFTKEWYKGSKGDALVRVLASYQCGPGSNPGVDAICGLSLLLVLLEFLSCHFKRMQNEAVERHISHCGRCLYHFFHFFSTPDEFMTAIHENTQAIMDRFS